jgi:hypothetical protein
MVLEESHDISPPKLPDFLPCVLSVQHIISLEQHVELSDSLPHARDKEDEDNPSLLDCVHTISTHISNMFVSFHTLDHLMFIVINLRSL